MKASLAYKTIFGATLFSVIAIGISSQPAIAVPPVPLTPLSFAGPYAYGGAVATGNGNVITFSKLNGTGGSGVSLNNIRPPAGRTCRELVITASGSGNVLSANQQFFKLDGHVQSQGQDTPLPPLDNVNANDAQYVNVGTGPFVYRLSAPIDAATPMPHLSLAFWNATLSSSRRLDIYLSCR